MVPKSSVNISASDCQKVLSKYYNNVPVKLIDFSVSPISDEINGFMGEHLILKITVDNGEKTDLRFFAKTMLADQETVVEYAKDADMFNKEVSCYKFLEKVKKQVPTFDADFFPKYYYDRDNEFIILEDVSEKGYKMWNGPLELDLEHLELCLSSTAKFHAASLIYEELKSKKLGRRYCLLEDYGKWLEEGLYKDDPSFLGFQYIQSGIKGLHTLIEFIPEEELSREDFKSKLTDLAQQVFEDIKVNNKYRHVWSHGDLWTKNVMFQYKDGKPVNCQIFDFQLQRYCPPANDVLFMIYQTTDREMRKKYFHYFLDYYYDVLKQELQKADIDISKILTRDEFDNSIVASFPMVKLTKTIWKSLSTVSAEYHRKITSIPEVYARINFEDRSDFVTDVFHNQKSYRQIMTILLEDLRDLLSHEGVTIEDCYKILRRKLGTTDYQLIEYKTVPLDEKFGFLGEHCKLKIKVQLSQKDTHEINLFAKSIPTTEAQKEYVTDNHLFFKEMKFYTEIVPKMLANGVNTITGCVPECYLARLDNVLVFDDFSVEGYTTLNCRSSYDYETTLLIIKKLARFHASSIILEEKLSSSIKKYRLNEVYPKELRETYYNDKGVNKSFVESSTLGTLSQIDLFSGLSSKIEPELFKKRTRKAFTQMLDLIKPSKRFRNTICHGDLWSNNILLQFKDNKCVDCIFIDLQNTRYTPPAVDVLNFLYFSTNRKFRSKYMQQLLDLYHSEISKVFQAQGIDIKDILSYEEFMTSCEELKKFVIPQTVAQYQVIMLSSDQIKELFSNPELNRSFFFENRGPYLTKICNEDSVFREKMRECITDLMEYCANSNDLD